MKNELRDTIDRLRIFAVMVENDEICEDEQAFFLGAIVADLEAIADSMSEADQ